MRSRCQPPHLDGDFVAGAGHAATRTNGKAHARSAFGCRIKRLGLQQVLAGSSGFQRSRLAPLARP
eukprot:442515-Alexandrium_andersonii.AAC.1